MKRPVLELKGIRKKFNNDFTLDNINLQLHQDEIHVLIGENGSGKSLLMKIIAGYFLPDAGKILYKGLKINYHDVNLAMREGIYYQHQELPVFENMSAAENIFFDFETRKKKRLRLWNNMETVAKCNTLFKELNINLPAEKYLGEYGFAERQLLYAAKAYISNAKIIIFDEPTAGMSEAERNVFFNILERIKEKTEAIFYISHRLDEILKIGDTLSVMEEGKIINSSSIKGLSEKEILKLITGRPELHTFPKIKTKPGKKVIFSVKDIKSHHILKGVTFNLHKQEILGITGLMGSGRTRLANCLFGVNPIDSGEIYVNGTQKKIAHPFDAMLAGLSLVPEDRNIDGLFNSLNTGINMTLPNLKRFLNYNFLDDNILQQVVKDYIKKLGIKPNNPDNMMHHLSGGNQQKVLLARWFMKRSLVYIMDEPTKGIDIASKIDIYNAMNNLVIKGASIVLLSSDMDEIIGMCDRVLILSDGVIVDEILKKDATREKIYSLAVKG